MKSNQPPGRQGFSGVYEESFKVRDG